MKGAVMAQAVVVIKGRYKLVEREAEDRIEVYELVPPRGWVLVANIDDMIPLYAGTVDMLIEKARSKQLKELLKRRGGSV